MELDTRIPLRKLEVFSLVVELQSITRAAERLFVAQPVVTAHVRSLEERLGAELVYRDGRRMLPTEAGETVYHWAQDVLTRSREMAREIGGLADGTRGSVVVGSSMTAGSYVLPAPLARFQRRHPEADITLDISDPEGAVNAVVSGKADFALVIEDVEQIRSPQLEHEEVGEEDLALVAAPASEPQTDSIPIKRLVTLPFVCSPPGLMRREMVERRLREQGVIRQNVVMALGHPEAMKRAAIDGLGAVLLFRSAVRRELEEGRLKEIAITDARLRVPMLLVHRRSKRFSPLQQTLLHEIREHLRGGVERIESPAELAAVTAT
jgi:DNA-binding transcriptional LysR family regulator